MRTDPAHKQTDDLIDDLEKRIKATYKRAAEETEEKLSKYLMDFERKDKKKLELVKAGKITDDEYKKWRTGQILIGKRWEEMSKTLATDLANADKISQSITQGYMMDAYALNHNYSTFEVEKASLVDTSYTLYDRGTVERLVKDEPQLLPDPVPGGKTDRDLREGKLIKWNQQKITAEVTQAILQGESIDKMARRMQTVTDMDRKASVRNARTAMTGAQNAGRQDGYERAQDLGLNLQKQWLAVMDGRTRHEHRQLDGVRVPVDEKFENDFGEIEYPGDPTADPANVYNCRCTMIVALKGFEKDFTDRHNDALGDMSYEEWKRGKEKEEKQTAEENTIKEVTNKAEAKEALSGLFGSVEQNFLKNDEELIVNNTNQLLKLNQRFGCLSENNRGYITATKSGSAMAWTSSPYRKDSEQTNLSLVGNWYKDANKFRTEEEDGMKAFWSMPFSKDNIDVYTVTHEYGHILESFVSRNRQDWDAIDEKINKLVNPSMSQLRNVYRDAEKAQAKGIFDEIVEIAKENNPEFKVSADNLSKYGHTNYFEAFAEMFANSQCGAPNELGKAMEQWLVKEGF